jgi:branched-chain amino acid transport system permease protein
LGTRPDGDACSSNTSKLDEIYGLLLTFGLTLIAEGIFRELYGVSGQNYPVPELLQGATDLGFMILPNYRACGGGLLPSSPGILVHHRTHSGLVLICAQAPKTLTGAGYRHHCAHDVADVAPAPRQHCRCSAAPIIQVTPLMGSNLIIVVFAVVVIGGCGSDSPR